MQILEQRFLRGPNIHAATPCLLSVLDLDDLYGVSTRDLPRFNDALLELLPSLADYLVPTGQPGGFAQRLREGTYLARVIEHVTLGLQCLAGAPVAFGRTRPVTGEPGQFRIVCAYQLEKVAQPAFALAVDIVDALAHDEPFDLAPRLDELRDLTEHYAVGTSTAAVLAAAQDRGIPVTRIAEDANLFQLGWGVKQKRIQATITGDTGTIAVRIAGDRQLTRRLLAEAGVPVPEGEAVATVEDALRVARELAAPVTLKPLDATGDEGVTAACRTDDEIERAYALARTFGRHVIVERCIDGAACRVLVAGGKVAAASLRGAVDGAGADADVTALLPESTRRLCVRAAAKIGLDVAGIDIVCRDIALPLVDQGGAVIDLHAAPGIDMHRHAGDAAARDVGDAIVTGLMGDSDGRIPIIACTGTNGKTTTTLLMAHTARLAGRVTGVATTHGVTIGGKEVSRGDCTGYWSARTVLSSPDVEFAVLETARGGILKRGLAFDRCDVGMVLNVAPDHLGLDGVDTVEDLAQVKAVVPLAASRAVVLNAEDPLCVAMARRVHPDVEVVYFSMEADNPVLLRHLEEGGCAVYLQDNSLVVADATYHQELLRVEAMPIAFGGRARYNVANGLAAAAGLMAAGFSSLQIATGLSTFVSDGKTNPLRTNVFDVRGVTVIVDYAHNPAAYAALAEMARALLPGQLVGIVTAPGDRRDADLFEVGRVCAARFDELVVYESSSRGREFGGAVDLILQGAEDVVGKTDTLHRELDVGEAIRLGLSLCRRGDVLVFACGSSLAVFVEAIRQADPESAARIAAQVG
ncbi:cyanophycin synthetase family protein [Massilia luteola]|uniref:cyanophycin synthetase family protein n=1 Tax=Massilia luteola TaxID=3081751 RepID=UPI002ACBEE38|nr:Mur ligase family protein [Massilia sp. Gc5]